MRIPKRIRKYMTWKLLATFGFIYVIHNGCDFVWFTIGRWTEIPPVMVVIGIILWSLVAALVLEKFHH